MGFDMNIKTFHSDEESEEIVTRNNQKNPLNGEFRGPSKMNGIEDLENPSLLPPINEVAGS